jgi:aspartyl-tRNA(Asn)/glutamyl-tRNA(Gln) amidotransferase subunit C
LAQQVATILDYVDTLGQVDTEGVPPTAHAIDLTNAFREDELHSHLPPDQALANAPAREDSSFVVPKVIG